MPGANESSTVAWQSAQEMPTLFSPPLPSENPFTPTTASRSSSESVVAGSSSGIVLLTMPSRTFWGRTSTSTFRPTASAVAGLTPAPTPPWAAPSMPWCSFNAPPQKSSSPNVS